MFVFTGRFIHSNSADDVFARASPVNNLAANHDTVIYSFTGPTEEMCVPRGSPKRW